MRKPFIAGNWKMHKTVKESLDLTKKINDFLKENDDIDVDVLICPPFTSIHVLKDGIEDRRLFLGAQNMYFEDEGAYTGEISPVMLKEIGIEYVIIGHSERRQYFMENDEIVNKKIKKALEHNLKPILCVGETLEEREEGNQNQKVENQITQALKNVNKKDVNNITIAYEPIWAIGTGKTASSDDANKMIKFIRKAINDLYDEDTSSNVRIQYGGSVKPHNIKELMNKSDIDGALVGGASLKAEDFIKIIDF